MVYGDTMGRLRSSYPTLERFPTLTHLCISGLPLDGSSLFAITQMLGLRFLDIEWYFPKKMPTDTLEFGSAKELENMPPIETLRIRNVRTCARILFPHAAALVKAISESVRWLSIHDSFDFDTDLADLRFPLLECFASTDVKFSAMYMSRFLERHNARLSEVSLNCGQTAPFLNLRTVSRILRQLSADDDVSGVTADTAGENWGKYQIGSLSYSLKTNMDCAWLGEVDNVVELKLAFPYRSWTDGPVINERISLDDLAPFFSHFWKLKALTISVFGDYEIVFKTFMVCHIISCH